MTSRGSKTATELIGYAKSKDSLEKFHKSFWDKPLALRTALLTDILFPQGTSNEAAKHITERMVVRMVGNDKNRPFSVSDIQTLAERTRDVVEENQKGNGSIGATHRGFFWRDTGKPLRQRSGD